MPKTKKATTKTKETKKTKAQAENKAEKFAVIKLAGTQLKVFEGKEYEVNKLEGKKGDEIEIKEVLLSFDGKESKIGKPLVKDSKVTLEITSQKKGKKIDGLIYKAKSRYRKRYGFRPDITRVLVKKIS
jgi:large subunit ribosomal protein L21